MKSPLDKRKIMNTKVVVAEVLSTLTILITYVYFNAMVELLSTVVQGIQSVVQPGVQCSTAVLQ